MTLQIKGVTVQIKSSRGSPMRALSLSLACSPRPTPPPPLQPFSLSHKREVSRGSEWRFSSQSSLRCYFLLINWCSLSSPVWAWRTSRGLNGAFSTGNPRPTVSCSPALVFLLLLSHVAIADELIVLLLISFSVCRQRRYPSCEGFWADCDHVTFFALIGH